MRFVKLFIVGFAGLFFVITLFSLIIPSKIKVSRVVVITGHSGTEILNQISDLHNWKNWQPLFKSDSVKIIFSSESTEKVKSCRILQNDKIAYLNIIHADSSSVKFVLGEKGESTTENIITINKLPVDNSLQVVWMAITKLNWYPWEKFYGIFIDKLTGPGYENSLNGLKEYVESKQVNATE